MIYFKIYLVLSTIYAVILAYKIDKSSAETYQYFTKHLKETGVEHNIQPNSFSYNLVIFISILITSAIWPIVILKSYLK